MCECPRAGKGKCDMRRKSWVLCQSGFRAKCQSQGLTEVVLCFYRTQELFSVHIQHKDALRRPSHCPLGTTENALCTWQDLAVGGE